MPELDMYKIFTSRLNEAQIQYMVTGAVAIIVYGEPRMTHDLDLVVHFDIKQIPQFVNLFRPEEFYCPPEEVIALEISRENRGHFNVIHHESGFKADFYPVGSEALSRWGMKNRRKELVSGELIWLAPPEYVITRKLEYYREGKSSKHINDIKKILEVSSNLIDQRILENFIREYDLQDEWESIGT